MKYKVKVTRVQGAGKKTFTTGEVVFESDFPTGIALELANSGHIELIKETETATEKVEETATEKNKKSKKI